MESTDYQLLLVEDSSPEPGLLRTLLRRAMPTSRLTQVSRLEEALDYISRQHHHAALVDLSSNQDASVHAVAEMRGTAPNMPILAFTENGQEDLGRNAVHEGAVEYLVKGRLAADTLGRSIQHAIERNNTHSPVREREKEAAHLSHMIGLGDLAWGLAHELSQPLTSINNYAESAIEAVQTRGHDCEYVRERLETISRLALQAGQIMQGLRRLAIGTATECTLIWINELILEVETLIDFNLLRNQATLQLLLAPDLPPAWGDPVQVSQVLFNLTRNALDAIEEVPVERRQISLATSLCGDMILVEVTDQGKGMDRRTLERVFQPRFTTKSYGMGIGLAICRTIAESLGGSLTCRSTPGHGSTFVFQLPVAEQQENRRV